MTAGTNLSATNVNVEVRELEPSDTPHYIALRLAALTDHPEAFCTAAAEWQARPRADIEKTLADHPASSERFLLGAFDRDTLIGLTGLFRREGTKRRHKADIVSVYVDPARRGRGVAGRLLDRAARQSQAMDGVMYLGLGVATSNRPAIQLYRSRGFEIVCTEPCAIRVDGVCYDEHYMERPVVLTSDQA